MCVLPGNGRAAPGRRGSWGSAGRCWNEGPVVKSQRFKSHNYMILHMGRYTKDRNFAPLCQKIVKRGGQK